MQETMDWTMVSNAEGALGRIRALGYLLIERYQADAQEAGRKLGADVEINEIRDLTVSDLRTRLAEPSLNLAYATFQNDEDVRRYLIVFLAAYDQATATNNETGGGVDAEPVV